MTLIACGGSSSCTGDGGSDAASSGATGGASAAGGAGASAVAGASNGGFGGSTTIVHSNACASASTGSAEGDIASETMAALGAGESRAAAVNSQLGLGILTFMSRSRPSRRTDRFSDGLRMTAKRR